MLLTPKRSKKDFFGNIYIALIARLLFAMLLFSICRIIFYMLNADLFPDMTFGHFTHLLKGGLKFDLTAIIYTNILFILGNTIPFGFRHSTGYQKTMKWIYCVTNSVALSLNCIDIIYYRFTLRRTTWSVFQEFSNDKSNFSLIGRFFVDYWYIAFILIALIFLLMWLYEKVKISPRPLITNKYVYYPVCLTLMVAAIGLSVGGIRGGFAHSTRPITISNAAVYTNNPIEIGIVLNTPFSIYRTVERTTFKRLDYYSAEELDSIYSPINIPKTASEFNKKNVIIFIIESMSKENIGSLNKDLDDGNYKGYTPFLDSLIAKSYTFKRSFGNGLKSIAAMPSILAGIPSFVDPYILSIYANNKIKGLAAILAENGYDCSFFHGAPNGSMGFDSFAKMAGFQHYYGKNEYNNDADFDGMWGIWDEPFFQFFAQTLNEKTEPFFGTIYSVSSHHPFTVPKEYEDKFPKGTQPIHQCIGYTDMALCKFFKTAANMSWFNSTLFVFVADHTNQLTYPESHTAIGTFSIPIIFYDPSGELQGFEEQQTAQQIDIMPTILSYLNYDKPYFAFGFDALDDNPDKTRFAINYSNGIYQLCKNNYLFQTQIDNSIALYDYDADPMLSNNLIAEQTETTKELTKLFRAFMQQYNNRMIDNQLTTTGNLP
jgi:phosphoglycerol transferase MdoB-like AlkP superfamily enzyme